MLPPINPVPGSGHLHTGPKTKTTNRTAPSPNLTLLTESSMLGSIHSTYIAQLMIGLRVDFHFKGHGTFTGEVIGYDSKEDFGHRLLHIVKFTDGEIDECPYPKIIKAHEDHLKAHGAGSPFKSIVFNPSQTGPMGPTDIPHISPPYNCPLCLACTGLHHILSSPNANRWPNSPRRCGRTSRLGRRSPRVAHPAAAATEFPRNLA